MGRSAGEAGGPSGDGGAAAQVAAAAQAAAARVAVAAAAAQAAAAQAGEHIVAEHAAAAQAAAAPAAAAPAVGLDYRRYALHGAADWAQAWCEREDLRKPPDEAAVWDARAQEFSRQTRHSDYAASFLARLDLAPGLTVLDMGAGSGALALPLAAAGHQVIAADISSGMLAELQKQADEAGLSDRIRCVQLDFNAPFADWEAVGLTEDCVDVALASRSTMVRDLAASLAKLEAVARQRVAVTMVTEYGPRSYKRMGELENNDWGLGGYVHLPDFIFAVNILLAQGRYPEVVYLDSYKPIEQADGAGGQRLIRWAFISWEVDWEGTQKGGQPGSPGSSASGALGASGSPHASGSLGSPHASGSLGSPHAPGSLGAPQPPSPPATPKEPHATQ